MTDDDSTDVPRPSRGEVVEPPQSEGVRVAMKTSWIHGAMLVALAGSSFAVGRCSVPHSHLEEDPRSVDQAEAPRAYVCPMHPQIRLKTPGKCPVCGMDLAEEISAAAPSSSEESTLAARSQRIAKVGVAEVERSAGARELHLLGTVVPDESRLRAVTSWTGGRIDKLVVRTTGAKVRRGQVIAELYSPELYAATRDYLVTLNRRDEGASGETSGSWMDGATKAARARLELLGMQAGAIERLEQSRKAPKTVKVRSQFSGTVIERRVETGNFVTAGAPLLSLADLSQVWVEVEAGRPVVRALEAVRHELRDVRQYPRVLDVTFHDDVSAWSWTFSPPNVHIDASATGTLACPVEQCDGQFVHVEVSALEPVT